MAYLDGPGLQEKGLNSVEVWSPVTAVGQNMTIGVNSEYGMGEIEIFYGIGFSDWSKDYSMTIVSRSTFINYELKNLILFCIGA